MKIEIVLVLSSLFGFDLTLLHVLLWLTHILVWVLTRVNHCSLLVCFPWDRLMNLLLAGDQIFSDELKLMCFTEYSWSGINLYLKLINLYLSEYIIPFNNKKFIKSLWQITFKIWYNYQKCKWINWIREKLVLAHGFYLPLLAAL